MSDLQPDRAFGGERADPLRPVVFTVLLALADGPLHGYAVMKAVNQRLRRRALVGPGTLYRTLKELRELGWIAHTEDVADSSDERRRYYAITERGEQAARAEAQRLAELVEVARRAHLLPSGRARS